MSACAAKPEHMPSLFRDMMDYDVREDEDWKFSKLDSGHWMGVNDAKRLTVEGDNYPDALRVAHEAMMLLAEDN